MLGSWSYDDRHDLIKETDARGVTTTYSYDAMGRPLSQVDALGQVRRAEYDPLGRPVTNLLWPHARRRRRRIHAGLELGVAQRLHRRRVEPVRPRVGERARDLWRGIMQLYDARWG